MKPRSFVARLSMICASAALALSLGLTGGAATQAATPTLTYTDSTGTTVTLTHTPKRIVCVTSICEDILWELGLQPAAISDKLSLEPEFYGAAAKNFPTIGGTFFQPSLEDIAKARPDLVIGLAGVHDKLRSALKPIAPLYIMDLSRYQDSIKYLRSIGKLTGRSERAEAAIARFMNELAFYKKMSPRTKSAAFMSGSPTNFALDTDGALYGGLFAQVTPWPWPAPKKLQSGQEQNNTIPYSLEQVLAVNPAVIFVDSEYANVPISKALASNPLWAQLKAVSSHQIYEVRPDIWEYGRGVHSLGIALAECMHLLYPSVFSDTHSAA